MQTATRNSFTWISCTVIATLLAGFGSAAADATVTFDPLNGIFTGTDTLTVQVTVDAGAVDLRGYTMVLEFDPTIVLPISVEGGSLLTGAACPIFFDWLNESAVGDSLEIDGASLGCSIDGPGNVVEMKFVGVTVGVSPLTCRSLELRDSLNATIPSSCVDGTIEYRIPIAVTNQSWGRVKAGYRR